MFPWVEGNRTGCIKNENAKGKKPVAVKGQKSVRADSYSRKRKKQEKKKAKIEERRRKIPPSEQSFFSDFLEG